MDSSSEHNSKGNTAKESPPQQDASDSESLEEMKPEEENFAN